MMRRLQVLTIGLFVSAWVLPAADISGIWLGSVQSGGRRPQLQDVAFQFTQKGTTLTGKLYLDQGSTPIQKGTIDGGRGGVWQKVSAAGSSHYPRRTAG